MYLAATLREEFFLDGRFLYPSIQSCYLTKKLLDGRTRHQSMEKSFNFSGESSIQSSRSGRDGGSFAL